MTSPRTRSIILTIISFVIIAAFVYYLYMNADKYLELLHLSMLGIAALMALSLLAPFLNGAIGVYMFRSLGANLSQREGFLLAAASTLANQLPISGGIVTRALYLKQKYDLSYAKYFSATLALFFCSLAVYGLLGIAILLYWLLIRNIVASSVLFIGFGTMAASLLIFIFPVDFIKIPEVLYKWVHQAVEGWTLISKNPVLMLKLLGLQTGTMFLMAFRYWLAFHMLSQNVSVSQVLLMACASVLTQLVSFAPGGLGVREAIVGGIASALGFDAATSVAAVVLDRLVSTVMVVIIGWISTIILGKEISGTSKKSEVQDLL